MLVISEKKILRRSLILMKKKIKVWIFEDPQMIECIFISLFHVSILSRNFNLRLTYYDYLYNILSLPKH